ncbi:CDC42 small effector protein 2 isoform X1 [Bos javanicus]|uniref:CDC42 small effector protein 2 isoform X1 n=2 Tax=Bos javanicus TaxID=9906 RepID=UPI002AA796D3|nr:CDC42 small effector protein 2 isoform X1 [Bos javanicus]
MYLSAATERRSVRRLSADPRPPRRVCTISAGAASPRCLGKGREPPRRAAGLSVGRGSRTFPPSPGRHLPARSFPRGLQPGLSALCLSGKGLLARGDHWPGASRRCGPEPIPAGGAGGGASPAAAARRRGPPAAPGARTASRPACARAWAWREGPGSGERAGERSCGRGGTAAAEPAPRAAAAGASGGDKRLRSGRRPPADRGFGFSSIPSGRGFQTLFRIQDWRTDNPVSFGGLSETCTLMALDPSSLTINPQ